MNALVKYQRRSFVVFLLLCLQQLASAQLSANFTASPQSGCSPLIVHFTDQSTGNPTQWKWDLGNGAISTLQNPSATYFNPGTYTIKLVVKTPANIDSTIKTGYITVYSNPTIKFGTADTSGCFPLAVHFTDSSTAGSGTMASWQWDLGDGILSSLQNPVHVYSAAGNYNITLQATNSFGCTRSLSRTQYVKISNGVSADFNTTVTTACSAPFSVQFNNNSSGPGALSYQWSFGDGAGSTAANPTHNYNNSGSYSITLITTSPQGCKDTVVKNNLLNIGNQQANFTAPLSACIGEPLPLINTSSPAPTAAHWNFGDGTSSSSLQPTKTFTSPGTYTIKLVSHFGACADSINKQVVIAAAPQASFQASKTDFCKTPSLVQFSSTNTGTLSWDFGDGTTSTSTNPAHTYTSEGNFTVTLIVTNASGCSDTLVKSNYIRINKPVIQLHGLPQTGCVPVTANLSATVTCSEPVLTWQWNLGDGTTSNLPSPSHVYPTAGNYNISLVITTPGGCTDSATMMNGVRGGNKPHAAFSVIPPVVCNGNAVQFTDSSYSNVDQWHWDFGDNSSSTLQNPDHLFGDIGFYTITLIVWSNTCPDTVEKANLVKVLPPTAGFTVVESCTDKYTKKFKDGSQGATTWQWSFGDGTTSSEPNPTHVYAAPGSYYVVLTVTNGNCSNSNNIWVKVVDEDPAIAAVDTVCKGQPLQLTTPHISNANISSWQWDFGDGTGVTQAGPLSHVYNASGVYTIKLTITDILGCINTGTHTVHVFGPTAAFQPNMTAACLQGNTIVFTDASTSDGQNNLAQWQWNFGDGNVQTNTHSSNPAHQYSSAGQYTVSLTVKDAFGCIDSSLFSPMVIAQPVADFYTPDTLSCTGQTISFINQSAGSGLQYQWNFGDGASSSSITPSHQYNALGTYTIALSVLDQYGCKDTLVRSAYVDISLPHALFSVSDSIGNCPPLMVHFTNHSTAYTQLQWNFGDGSSSTLTDPSHYYTTPGTFYAMLIATGPGGCSDTAVQKIVVKGPTGTISYTPLTGCNPLTVQFTVDAQNSTSFVWDFSDGSTQATTLTSTSHTYTTAGEVIPRIILSDAAGCNVAITATDTIRVIGVKANFFSDLTRLCDHGNIQFTSTSVANDLITGYHWIFGDGQSTTNPAPIHYYDTVGVYDVKLIVTTAAGCVDSFTKITSITVFPKPEISIIGDSSGCMPAQLNFDGAIIKGNASALAWQWNFDNGQTSTSQHPAAQQYNSDGHYTVRASAITPFGCSDTAIREIEIHPLPQTNAGNDVSVCKGGSIQLQATGADSYSWSPGNTLSCASCPSTLAAPLTNTLYILTGRTSFGCEKNDSVSVTVYQDLLLKVGPGDTICAGEKAKLEASGAESYTWYPALNMQSPNSATTMVSPSTTTTYHVIGRDPHNCFTDTADVLIKVYPIPTVNAGADQQLVIGESIQLSTTTTGEVLAWQWNNAATLSCANCPVTLAKPKQTTTYYVTVKNGGGCTAQDNITINVICNNGNLFMPNAFSPNGDGVNDRFYPSGKGINMIKILRVYNRWGEVVFEKTSFSANDANAGWDGTFKGQVLPPDVYVYACDVVCQNNEVLSFKGDVTLLR